LWPKKKKECGVRTDLYQANRLGLSTQLNEHIQDIRYNHDKLLYAKDSLECIYEFGPIYDTMETLIILHKGIIMDVQKKFHLYKAQKFEHLLNEWHIATLRYCVIQPLKMKCREINGRNVYHTDIQLNYIQSRPLHQCHSPPALCQLQWLSAVKE
jgi:hypothetical protein